MKRLSVIIINHNNKRFVSAAIDSALAMCWDDAEVIVIDDGSTDGSPAVIEEYSDRVVVVLTENSTHRVAANRGHAMATGDAVMFLDADDVVPPELPTLLAKAWRPTLSKAQFRMQRIDDAGIPFGNAFPRYRPAPTPAAIRRWATTTTAYPTPPGSANAYAKSFLDQIFPLDASVGDFADSACLAAAPFLGDVVSVPEVVVGYRRHSTNDSDLLKDDQRFPREVARARARWRFAQQAIGIARGAADERPLFRSRELLQLRVAAVRLAPHERPLPGDGRVRMMWDALRAPFHPGPESIVHRALITGWCIAVLLAPARVVRCLLALRYGQRR